MINILHTIGPFFIIIAVGAILRLFIADDKWVAVFNKFGYYIGFPAIVITSFAGSQNTYPVNAGIIGLNIIILISIMAIALFATRILQLGKSIGNTYIICVIFGNIAYLGYPVITSIAPDTGAVAGAHIGVYLAVVFTVGILILEISAGKGAGSFNRAAKHILKNPLLISVFIGSLVAGFNVSIPVIIEKPINLIASAASPIVLLALGIFIVARIKFNNEFLHSAIISAIKLIAVPGIFLAILILFNPDPQFKVSTLESAMPIALTPFAMAEVYPMNKRIIAISILLTTAASLITLTVFAAFLGF